MILEKNSEIDLEDVEIVHYVRNNKGNKHQKVKDYDYCFTTFGVIMSPSEPYKTSGTIAIKCKNPNNKNQIISFLKYLYRYNKRTKFLTKRCISSNNIGVKDIEKLLKICITGIK